MSRIYTFKTCALAVVILLGLIAQTKSLHAQQHDTLVVAGGCFWCVEADFETVDGVVEVISGFTGGDLANPTYKQVVNGGTGHLEAVQITFDSAEVSVDTLLMLFFRSVDPTDKGGQFCDRGPTYTTGIFVTPQQRKAAEKAKGSAQADLSQIVVTPILDASDFYPADAYHQNYYKQKGLVLTRFGPKTKAGAYKAYRKACGRDARVKQLWGMDAPFADN